MTHTDLTTRSLRLAWMGLAAMLCLSSIQLHAQAIVDGKFDPTKVMVAKEQAQQLLDMQAMIESTTEFNKQFAKPKPPVAPAYTSPPRQYLPETVPQFKTAAPQKKKFFRPYNKKGNSGLQPTNPYAGNGTGGIDPPLPGSEAARTPVAPPPPTSAPSPAPQSAYQNPVPTFQPAPTSTKQKKKFFRPYKKSSNNTLPNLPQPTLPAAPPMTAPPTATVSAPVPVPAPPIVAPAPPVAPANTNIFRPAGEINQGETRNGAVFR